MEILLNPNVAYLVLVGAWMLILLAVITPGTGLLEVGALILSILSGWLILQIPINLWAVVILAAGLVLFIMALRYPRQPLYLGGAILLFVLGSSYIFSTEQWWLPAVNPGLALLTSILSGGFVWIATRKSLEARRLMPRHNLERLIGLVGEAKSSITDAGSVQVDGELWSARCVQRNAAPINAGERVRVVGREGLVLIVEPV